MLCSTTDQNLRTRDHPVLMSQLLEVGLDPGRDDPTLNRLRLLDQAEVEEVHLSKRGDFDVGLGGYYRCEAKAALGFGGEVEEPARDPGER